MNRGNKINVVVNKRINVDAAAMVGSTSLVTEVYIFTGRVEKFGPFK